MRDRITTNERGNSQVIITIVLCLTLLLGGAIGAWVYIERGKTAQRERQLQQEKQLKEKELEAQKDAAKIEADGQRDAASKACRAAGGSWFTC